MTEILSPASENKHCDIAEPNILPIIGTENISKDDKFKDCTTYVDRKHYEEDNMVYLYSRISNWRL